VVGEQLLRKRLVAREQQAARIAARVRELEQLEVGDDVLIEDGDVIEGFEQVEGDLRFPLGHQPADLAEVVVDAERLHFVTQPAQCRDHVVLGAPGLGRDVGSLFHRVGRNQVPVDERQDTKFADRHSATRCRPLCR
jgi:hypothetical protein